MIDPATSILYFFGRETHGNEWKNEVWSYDPASMTWVRSYPEDAPAADWSWVNLPPGAPDSWWEYHPAGLAWTPVPRGRIWNWGISATCLSRSAHRVLWRERAGHALRSGEKNL